MRSDQQLPPSQDCAGSPRSAWTLPNGLYNRALTQTTLYLTEPEIREKAQRAVLDLIDEKTEIVIGHSLGSVVAY